jgi:bifunctional UDP-N-acetylglucosamine pyrophosphorylase/glucosamine-1-phosphate N-acetyltransferase
VIDLIHNNNAKGEYYLTDTIELINRRGGCVKAHVCADPCEGQGVNDMADLALAASMMRKKINLRHMREGVQMIDPETVYIDSEVKIARAQPSTPAVCWKEKLKLARRLP